MDRWISTSWGLLRFESMKRSSFLDTKFSCFFEMSFWGVVLNDEASHIIPPRYPHDLFWHWLLIRPIVIQCAYPWRDPSIIVNKSCQSFPCNNSWVLPRVRINQFHYLWWPPMFLVVNAFARSDDFVHLWLLLFVPPSCESKWQPFNFFSQILLSCGIPVWNDIMDRWFLIFLDFFVLYQWKSLLSWITSFLVSLGWVSWV